METPSAWVLNLDADLELAAVRGYRAKATVQATIARQLVPLLTSLLGPHDLLVSPRPDLVRAEGFIGRAFCPTDSALGLLLSAGAQAAPHPPMHVLRRVNSRAFSAALGQTLAGGQFTADLQVLRNALSLDPVVGSAWRVKYAFGMAGRNQRVLPRGDHTESALSAFARWLSRGGVQVEPNVTIVEEFAIHGTVRANGAVRLGAIVAQRCNRAGAWISSERVTGLAARASHFALLSEEAERVASALHAADYLGPFGVDSFVYRDCRGGRHLQIRSEVNARYSLGFGIGFGRPSDYERGSHVDVDALGASSDIRPSFPDR